MRRCIAPVLLATMISLVLAATAGAEEQSALLRLKFAPNQKLQYRLHVVIDGAAKTDVPEAAESGIPGEVPVHMVVDGVAIAKVLRVDSAGAARLSLRAGDLVARFSMFGQQMDMSVRNGKYVVKQNGRTIEGGKLPRTPMVPGLDKIPFIQTPVEVKLGARGEMLDFAIPGVGGLSQLMPGVSLQQIMPQQVLLPQAPLTVGQTWGDSASNTIPELGGVPVVYDTKMTLSQIEDWAGGRKIAKIAVKTVTSTHNMDLGAAMAASAKRTGQQVPPVSGKMSVDAELGGTMSFDTTRGMLVRFDFEMNEQIGMSMDLPAPQGGPQSGTMNMQFTIKGALAKI